MALSTLVLLIVTKICNMNCSFRNKVPISGEWTYIVNCWGFVDVFPLVHHFTAKYIKPQYKETFWIDQHAPMHQWIYKVGIDESTRLLKCGFSKTIYNFITCNQMTERNVVVFTKFQSFDQVSGKFPIFTLLDYFLKKKQFLLQLFKCLNVFVIPIPALFKRSDNRQTAWIRFW